MLRKQVAYPPKHSSFKNIKKKKKSKLQKFQGGWGKLDLWFYGST